MRSIRSVAAFLVCCLLLGSLGVTAWAQQVPEIKAGETVTFSTTKKDHIVYYSFTPVTNGTYVLYNVGDQTLPIWASVHTVAPSDATFGQNRLALGLHQVVFQAQAGVTYWLKLDCPGAVLSHSFKLGEAVTAKGIDIAQVALDSNHVGSEGKLYLRYTPVGSAAQITWASSDSSVAVVEGDANGAKFQLTGSGTATITATAADGLTAQYQVEAVDMLEMQEGQALSVTMHESGGSYITTEKAIRFIPSVSGKYVLSVDYDESLDVWHGLEMSLDTADGYQHGSKQIQINVEAGKTYTVMVEFWGMYEQSVEYTFSLLPCVAPTGMKLTADSNVGYAGSSIVVGIDWEPDNSFTDAVKWSVSDSTVAKITSSDEGAAKIKLLRAGEVVVTASTADGISDSLMLTVYEYPGIITLFSGANPAIQMLGSDYFDCRFKAETTGYYRFSADSKHLKIKIDADTVALNGEKLYYLEEGKTYSGGIDNLSESAVQSVITVALVEVPTPKSIKITKMPEQTEFLPGVLEDIWIYDLLEGMEMEVTWTDGRTSVWSFNRDDTSFEGYDVRWELRDDGPNQKKLIMRIADATTSCLLTIKNLNVVRMELLDAQALEVVENSCGYYDEYVKSWIYSDYLLGTQRIKITFDDGSSVTARAGQTIYGKRLFCDQNQYDKPWVKDGDNSVVYSYDRLTIQVPVHVVDSPVRRIQFVTRPPSSFEIGNRKFFVNYGDDTYYFSPDSLQDYLEGLSFKIFYKNDTYKIVDWEDIEWVSVSGVRYPFVDGYPLGLLGELMMSYDSITGPCTSEGMVEYMGASLTYTIELVEPAEDVPETSDFGMELPVNVLVLALLVMVAVVTYKKKQF